MSTKFLWHHLESNQRPSESLYVRVENIKAAVNIIVASTMVTHSGLKLVDKPVCALYAVMCLPEDGDLLLKHVGG
jgi:hypothetical protein